MANMFITITTLTSDEIHKLQLAAIKFADGDMNKFFTILAKNYLMENVGVLVK